MISIILPVFNEEKFIKKAIDSILFQNISEEKYEILIADGMSTDGTREIIKSYQNNNKNIFLLNNPKRIVSTGFNIALTQSRGDIIIRLDGHAEFAPNYFEKCIKTLYNREVSCSGGIIIYKSSGIIGNSIRIAQSSNFGVGGVTFRNKKSKAKFVQTLAFGAYKREIFELIGGYDEELIKNQDDEFNFRMNQKGYKIWLDPVIKSYYHSRDNFKKLFRQYYFYGFYKVRVIQKRTAFSSWRHLVPGVFVLCLIFSIFHKIIDDESITFNGILSVYMLLNIIYAIMEISKRRNIKGLGKKVMTCSCIIISFIILHVSYGIGFIFGSIYFIKKWGSNKVNDNHFKKNIFISNNEH